MIADVENAGIPYNSAGIAYNMCLTQERHSLAGDSVTVEQAVYATCTEISNEITANSPN